MGHRELILRVVFIVAASAIMAVAQPKGRVSTASQPDFDTVIQRLELTQRNARPQESYQVTRRYQLLESKSAQVKSDVVAEVVYTPPAHETYVLQKRAGSGRGEEVVRHILDHESALLAAGPQSWSAALVTHDNYTFTNLGESMLNGTSYYLLGLIPKRPQAELIAGRAWVDKTTFRLRRIEGEMAKSPSWWLKKVNVRLDFTDMSGLWLQSAMEARADVRFVGSQTLRAQTIDCRRAEIMARVSPKPARRIRRGVPAQLIFPAVR